MSKHSKEKYTKPEPGTYGYRLMQARKSAGFTQAKLADRLGISRTMLIMYEHNDAQMRCDIIIKCLEVLGASFDEVFGGNDSQKKGVRQPADINNLIRTRSSNKLLLRFLAYLVDVSKKNVGGNATDIRSSQNYLIIQV